MAKRTPNRAAREQRVIVCARAFLARDRELDEYLLAVEQDGRRYSAAVETGLGAAKLEAFYDLRDAVEALDEASPPARA